MEQNSRGAMSLMCQKIVYTERARGMPEMEEAEAETFLLDKNRGLEIGDFSATFERHFFGTPN